MESDITQRILLINYVNDLRMTLEDGIAQKMEKCDNKARRRKFFGGIVEVMIAGLKPGIGNPFFESIESEISENDFFRFPATRRVLNLNRIWNLLK